MTAATTNPQLRNPRGNGQGGSEQTPHTESHSTGHLLLLVYGSCLHICIGRSTTALPFSVRRHRKKIYHQNIFHLGGILLYSKKIYKVNIHMSDFQELLLLTYPVNETGFYLIKAKTHWEL